MDLFYCCIRWRSDELRDLRGHLHEADQEILSIEVSLLTARTGTAKLVDHKVRSLRACINMDTERQKESSHKLARLDGVQLACTAHSGCTGEVLVLI